MPELTKIAFDDPSWRSNPRMPLVKELVELYWSAFYGRGARPANAEVKVDKLLEDVRV